MELPDHFGDWVVFLRADFIHNFIDFIYPFVRYTSEGSKIPILTKIGVNSQ